MTNAGIKAILKDKKPSTRWLQFYLNTYLFIVLVFEAASVPDIRTALLSVTVLIMEGEILGIVLFLTGMFTAVTTIGTFVELRSLTILGYKWNIAMLCSYFIRTCLCFDPTWWESGARIHVDLLTVPIIVTSGMLVWLLTNLIYFKKRRHLFRAYTAVEVEAAIKGESPATALPVDKAEATDNAGMRAPLTSNKTSNKWLIFYLNGYLLFMLAYVVYFIPQTLTRVPSIAERIKSSDYLPLIEFFIEILAGVSAIITFTKTRKLQSSGYRWNTIMIWSCYVTFVVRAFLLDAVDQTKTTIYIRVAIAAIIFCLLTWVIPNLIYFKKRKHLFRPHTTSDVVATIKSEPPAPVLPIREPCQDKPTKAKVDTRKLRRSENGITRLAALVRKRKGR